MPSDTVIQASEEAVQFSIPGQMAMFATEMLEGILTKPFTLTHAPNGTVSLTIDSKGTDTYGAKRAACLQLLQRIGEEVTNTMVDVIEAATTDFLREHELIRAAVQTARNERAKETAEEDVRVPRKVSVRERT